MSPLKWLNSCRGEISFCARGKITVAYLTNGFWFCSIYILIKYYNIPIMLIKLHLLNLLIVEYNHYIYVVSLTANGKTTTYKKSTISCIQQNSLHICIKDIYELKAFFRTWDRIEREFCLCIQARRKNFPRQIEISRSDVKIYMCSRITEIVFLRMI